MNQTMRIVIIIVLQIFLMSCTTIQGDITKYSLNGISAGEVFTLQKDVFISDNWSHGKEFWGVEFYGAFKPSKYAAGVPENFSDYEINKEKYSLPPIKIIGFLPKGTNIKFKTILSSGSFDPVIVSICTMLTGEFKGKHVNLMPLFKHDGNFKYYNDHLWLTKSQ